MGRRLSAREVLKSDRLVLDAQQSGLALVAPGHVGKLRTVVDVGANTGQWSGMLLNLVRPEKLVIVEPLPDAFAVFKKNSEIIAEFSCTISRSANARVLKR